MTAIPLINILNRFKDKLSNEPGESLLWGKLFGLAFWIPCQTPCWVLHTHFLTPSDVKSVRCGCFISFSGALASGVGDPDVPFLDPSSISVHLSPVLPAATLLVRPPSSLAGFPCSFFFSSSIFAVIKRCSNFSLSSLGCLESRYSML